jgi:predicted transcriptional regulator
MKTFTFRYDPKATFKDAMDKMFKSANSGKPHIEKNEIRSASLKALLTIATENRLRLFRLIHENQPASVYDLAKLFERDMSYVSKEVRVLEGLGLISLVKETVQGRERFKPVALYDRILVDFNLAGGRKRVS